MPSLGTIVLDLDGTLVDISRRHYDVYALCVRAEGGGPLERSAYWEAKRSKTTWTDILEASRVDSTRTEGFMQRFVREIENPTRLAGEPLITGARSTLDELRRQGWRLDLVSLRRHHDRLLRQLELLGIGSYFSRISSGRIDRADGQANAELIAPLVAAHQVACVVGDTEADVLAARSLGLTGVAVTSGIRAPAALIDAQPDQLLESIAELPGTLARLGMRP